MPSLFSIFAVPLLLFSALHLPITQTGAPPTYASIGDSIAAGSDLPQADGSTCSRSALAFPNDVADRLHTNVEQLACGGANVRSTLDQLEHVYSGKHPDILTVSIGANDSQWIRLAQGCNMGDCKTLLHDANFQVYLAKFRIDLLGLLQRIKGKSDGQPPVVLLNEYYDIFSGTTCPGSEQISTVEREWIHDLTTSLNRVIHDTGSQFDFVRIVPLDDFDNHMLCSTDPWVQGIDDAAPLHPTIRGQQAIADAVWRTLTSEPQQLAEHTAPQVLGVQSVDCLPQLTILGQDLPMFRINSCPMAGQRSDMFAGRDLAAPALFAHR